MSSRNRRKANARPTPVGGKSAAAFARGKQRPQRLFAQGGWPYRAVCYAAYAVMLVAVLGGFDFVRTYGVNLFWADDWIRVPMLSDYFAGTLTPTTFWELQNEHRIVFPKAVMLVLDLLTKGNVVADMYVGEVLLAAILVIFVAAFRRHFRGGPAIWLMAPMAFLVFSLRQYENMLWGFQIGFFMVVAAALAAFFGLSALKNERYAWIFGGTLLASTVAAFSSIHGLLVWPVGLGQLFIAPLGRRLKIVLSAVWATIGAAEWSVYFIGWTKPTYHPPIGFSWRYLATIVGAALTTRDTMALWAGVLLLVLTAAALAIVFFKRQWPEQSFWLATMAFTLGSLGAITAGRSGFTEAFALTSRYATASIPLVVAIYAIFASQSAKKLNMIGISLMSVVLVMAVAGTADSFVEGRKEGGSTRTFRNWQQVVIATIDSQPDAMIQVYRPPLSFIRQSVAFLKERGYSLFAYPDLCARCQLPDPSLPTIAATTRCGIFGPVSIFNLRALLIRGWAVDWPAGDAAGGVTVLIDGVAYPAYYGSPNDEVAKMLGSDKFLLSEFQCGVPTKDVKSGSHRIVVKVLTHDRKAYFQPDEEFEFLTP